MKMKLNFGKISKNSCMELAWSKKLIVGSFLVAFLGSGVSAREIALTFDDAPTPDSALMTGNERTEKLIAALKSVQVDDVMFFIKADYINDETRRRLLKYADAGFHIANHSYSHRSAEKIPHDDYLSDVYRAHILIKDLPNFLTFHRFPYLHAGKDQASVDYLQKELNGMGYRDGYVTVDNFDWFISSLLTKAVEEKKTIDYDKARDFYVQTLVRSIEFYDALAQKTLGRSPRHIMLLHENDAAALFVDDLVIELRKQGWKVISPQKAYQDKIAKTYPNTQFQKQGRIAAIAASKGVAQSELRHESENEVTLTQAFNAAGIAE
jgi:peptidoglycan-N-acetylglucosamine deacetylase